MSSSNNKITCTDDDLSKYDTREHAERMAKYRDGRQDKGWDFMTNKTIAKIPGSSEAATAGSHEEQTLKRSDVESQGILGEYFLRTMPENTKNSIVNKVDSSVAAPAGRRQEAQNRPEEGLERKWGTPPGVNDWKSSHPIQEDPED
jgi:hypothetical protein